jgi:hypothetical protein
MLTNAIYSSANTYYANLRRTNGHDAPYGVKVAYYHHFLTDADNDINV